jgi:hypothetical protein
MLKRVLFLSLIGCAAMTLSACAPDPALKKGEVIDRGVHHGATQTTPENHPSDAAPAQPVAPK